MKRRDFLKGLAVAPLAVITVSGHDAVVQAKESGVTQGTLDYVESIRVTGRLRMTQFTENSAHVGPDNVYAILWTQPTDVGGKRIQAERQIIDITVNGKPWTRQADYEHARELFRRMSV